MPDEITENSEVETPAVPTEQETPATPEETPAAPAVTEGSEVQS